MSKWSKIYKKQINEFRDIDSFIKYKINYKKRLIRFILKNVPKKGKILEIGCGSGVTCDYLSKEGYEVTGIDIDKDMLKLAENIANKIHAFPKFMKMNLKSLDFPKKYFDVVFSDGVLEHFSDREIVSIINDQLNVAKIVIISVPSNHFKKEQRILGDERFMDIKKWEIIISKTKGKEIKRFGFGFQGLYHEILYPFLKKKMIKNLPFIGFVIKNP